MKRLVFCFDGSWNQIDALHPTNVLFTAQSVLPIAADGTVQEIFYDEGVGTEKGEKLTGGMFGKGSKRTSTTPIAFSSSIIRRATRSTSSASPAVPSPLARLPDSSAIAAS